VCFCLTFDFVYGEINFYQENEEGKKDSYRNNESYGIFSKSRESPCFIQNGKAGLSF